MKYPINKRLNGPLTGLEPGVSTTRFLGSLDLSLHLVFVKMIIRAQTLNG